MEFDSPDVAKEFPGLYYEDIDESGGGGGKGRKAKGMNDPNEYDDDSDKSSKKKKDKKDSKKDKGYAALAGESSPDEDGRGSKSPGRVKKLKGFKLTSSSKKHKEKEKDASKDSKPESSSKASSSGGESSKKEKDKLDKKHSLALEKDAKKERKLSSEAAKPPKSDKSLLDLVRKHSVPNSASTSVSLAPPAQAERPSSTGRNRHLVPFSPTAAKEAAKEEKHSKKEIIDGVKVRLKLKRGSKNSLEEPGGDHPTSAAPSSTQAQQPGRQLPEDPEALAKEIKKYEALLEQSHSQIQSSKKVSKKHEEQLWELQRTLTQLKRKLRSVNALSCGPIITNNTTFNPPPASTTKAVVEQPQPQRATMEPVQAVLQPQRVPIEPAIGVGVDAPPELIPESVEEISQAQFKPDLGVRSPTESTVQVQAEVHSSNEKAMKYPITDAPEYENITIGQEQQTQSKRAPPLEKKGSESSNSSFVFENVPDTNFKSRANSTVKSSNASTTTTSQLPDPPITTTASSRQPPRQHPTSVDLDEVDNEFKNLHLGNNVDARAKRNSLPSSQRLQRDRETSSSPFNPFVVPIFQSDEFIALENEALIMFNQALQDQIIDEEAEVEKLVNELGDMIEDNHGLLLGISVKDLDDMDNDELISMFETAKHENDVLHDQVSSLKSRVAQAKLEEFQLELRLKYLQERELLDASVPPASEIEAVVT